MGHHQISHHGAEAPGSPRILSTSREYFVAGQAQGHAVVVVVVVCVGLLLTVLSVGLARLRAAHKRSRRWRWPGMMLLSISLSTPWRRVSAVEVGRRVVERKVCRSPMSATIPPMKNSMRLNQVMRKMRRTRRPPGTDWSGTMTCNSFLKSEYTDFDLRSKILLRNQLDFSSQLKI